MIGLTVVAALLALLVPAWLQQDRALAYDRAGSREVAAEQWIQAHVPHGKRILIDDTMWVDLVRRGFNPKLGVIWFYKVDFTNNLDPSVARALPDGYRDVDYVVSTPVMRSALDQQPQGLQQLRAATVVTAKGDGELGQLPARTGLAHGRAGFGSRGASGGTTSLRTSIRWAPVPMVVSSRL